MKKIIFVLFFLFTVVSLSAQVNEEASEIEFVFEEEEETGPTYRAPAVIPISSSGLTYLDIYTEDWHHYRAVFIA
ncbi:MAG: hypothetical protein IJ151_03065 [Bacteroidales bacterium]|nr:hypothetical protein [Bacteroidales bacterium]